MGKFLPYFPTSRKAHTYHSLKVRVRSYLGGPILTVITPIEPTFGSLRTTHTTPSAIDGSATTHLSVKCTLLDIAKATNLRPEDVAYAMEECGFLLRRKNEGKNEDGSDREVILVSREMVEAVAKERGVKDTFISVNHVIL